jgi:hypothetical protein
MSELIDLNTLFASELGDTQQSLFNKGIAMADVPLGRMADVLAPKQASSLRKAAGGLFGVDTSTSKERLQQALTSLDLSNEGDQAKAVELVRAQSPAAALTLQQQFKRSKEASALNTSNIANNESLMTSRAQNVAINTAQLGETVRSNEATERSSMRTSALQQARLSQDVFESNRPQLFNTGRGEVVSVDNEGKSTVVFRSDDGATTENKLAELMAKRTALSSAVKLSYPNDPEAQRVLTENIDAGNIENASDFGSYVPQSEAVGAVELPVAALKMVTSNQETSVKSLNTLGRLDSLISTIENEGLLDVNSPAAGLLGRARERIFDEAGIRDSVSILKTGTTREINTEIINSLPPGVASDRDIAIFSKGYPPEGTNTAELYEYLKAAKRINEATVDVTRLRENHWLSQTSKGDSVSDLGFLNTLDQYNTNVTALDDYLEQARGLPDTPENQELIKQAFNAFSNEFGFIPKKHR